VGIAVGVEDQLVACVGRRVGVRGVVWACAGEQLEQLRLAAKPAAPLCRRGLCRTLALLEGTQLLEGRADLLGEACQRQIPRDGVLAGVGVGGLPVPDDPSRRCAAPLGSSAPSGSCGLWIPP
jgi:hypothetical protein